MSQAGKLLKSLEKEGLQDGRLLYQNKEYFFSKKEGFTEVDSKVPVFEIEIPKEKRDIVEIDLEKEVDTINRGKVSRVPQAPAVKKEKKRAIATELQKRKKENRIFTTVFFILLFVVSVLIGIFVVVYLNIYYLIFSNLILK